MGGGRDGAQAMSRRERGSDDRRRGGGPEASRGIKDWLKYRLPSSPALWVLALLGIAAIVWGLIGSGAFDNRYTPAGGGGMRHGAGR